MTRPIDPSGARSIADVSAGTVLATVEIAAEPERVFQAITDPRELMTWWGSGDTYRAHSWTADVRVGGRWRAEGKSVDGRPYAVFGEYLEIARPHRMVHSWCHDWDAEHPPTRVTYTLEALAGGTRLTVRHEGFVQPQACDAHARGWARVLDWLSAYVSTALRPGL
jgi:uncharacterized protein YndB with AHSA1/START domain